MNWLEVFTILAVASLGFCVRDGRNWMRRAQSWEVLDWLWVITHGLLLCFSSIAVVYLATHSTYIQPAPTWLSWTVGLVLAMAFLELFAQLAVNTGRRIRQPGR